MKFKLDIDPDIVAMMAAEVAAGERAVTAAMREAGTGLKSAWRLQITGAGLGTRLANSIRSQNFPRSGESLDAAALVWSKAPVIVGAHDTGPLIRSKNGFWLAVPLPAAGKSLRGGRIPPANGSGDAGCACGSSIAAPDRACWSPTAPGSTRVVRRWRPARKRGATRSPHRSSCWSRRSSCRSGSTSTGTPSGRMTACRGLSWRTGWRGRSSLTALPPGPCRCWRRIAPAAVSDRAL